jgi:hypothetical protein
MAEDEAPPELLCRRLDLPAELLVAIAAQLAEDDELAASLSCRKLREAVAGTERRKAGAALSTTIGSSRTGGAPVLKASEGMAACAERHGAAPVLKASGGSRRYRGCRARLRRDWQCACR